MRSLCSLLDKTRVWTCLFFMNPVSRISTLIIVGEVLLVMHERQYIHPLEAALMFVLFMFAVAALLAIDFGCRPVENYARIRQFHAYGQTTFPVLERFLRMNRDKLPPCKKSSLILAVRDIRIMEKKYGPPQPQLQPKKIVIHVTMTRVTRLK